MGGLPRRQLTAFRSDECGQSVFDFAIGVSLFLIVVLGVIVFIPTMFTGFGTSGSASLDDRRAADRVAESLAGSALADKGDPSRLDVACMRAFFADENACGFESGGILADAGLSEGQPLSVAILDTPDGPTMCWDEDGGTMLEASDSDCDLELAAGSTLQGTETYASASHPVQLAGIKSYLVVRTW